MSGTGKKSHAKLEQAVLSLLSTGSIDLSAKELNVSVSTMGRIVRSDAFQSLYRESRRRIYEQGMSTLQTLVGEAVMTLRLNLKATRPSVQVKAATTILLHAMRACELMDISERLTKLEAMQEAKS
jgi:hypothetical protein